MNKSIKFTRNILVRGEELELLIFNDDSFQVNQNGEELNNFKDSNGFFVYYHESIGAFFKHEIAKEYMLDDYGDCIMYVDGDLSNTKLNNLKKCSYREYREVMIQKSREHDKKKKEKTESRTNAVDKAIYNEDDKFYQVELPNGEKEKLKKNMSIEEKLITVQDLLIKWEDYILMNWNSNSVKFFLDSLSNYLVWHVEYDKPIGRNGEILSNRKTNRLNKLESDNKLDYFESNQDEREMYY